MTSQEHLDVLKRGWKTWNAWRRERPEVRPDFSDANLRAADLLGATLRASDLSRADLSRANFNGADLSHANLNGANLNGANLNGANLNGADLNGADLKYAHLISADLRGADLSHACLLGADLSHAYLLGASLSDTDLSDTDLSDAYLLGADLSHANLNGANLNGAYLRAASLRAASLRAANLRAANLNDAAIGWTIFADVDLRTAKGLETVHHEGPSTIGTDTISRSEGDIPEVFLRGAGLSDAFITSARSLAQHPIEYYTCFLSYSSKDQDFAGRLYTNLQQKGVRCWFAPEDMKTGDKIRQRIDESIRLYDRLLLVLSEHSIASAWVEFEVEAALSKEQTRNAMVLFPVRLDAAVMESTTSWAAHLQRTRHITDFTRWKQHDDYQKAFARLLRDLQPDTPPTEKK